MCAAGLTRALMTVDVAETAEAAVVAEAAEAATEAAETADEMWRSIIAEVEEDHEEGEDGEGRDGKASDDKGSGQRRAAICSLHLSKGLPPCGSGNTRPLLRYRQQPKTLAKYCEKRICRGLCSSSHLGGCQGRVPTARRCDRKSRTSPSFFLV